MYAKIFRTMLIFFLIAGGFFAPVSQAHAATIRTVTNDNDSGTGSLRQAILNAASGDTITFDPLLAGKTITLASQIDINKNLTIDGSGLEPRVTISGNNSVRVMSISANTTATIKSLVIKNGKRTGTNYTEFGGAITTGSNSVLSIENVAFIGNSAYRAGAIYVGSSANVTVFKSEFTTNSSETLGGAIYVNGYLTLRNSALTGNTASSGGAVYIYYKSGTFENNVFSNNSAKSGGAFIIEQGSNNEVYMRNNLFSGNLATTTNGGALNIYLTSIPAILNIENNTFYANQAANSGGAIYNYGSAILRNNTFSHNQANKSGGNAGASLYGGGTLYNNIFANNTGGGECYGGGTPAGSNNLAEDGSPSCRPTLTGDPSLLALADNGGPTYTMALAPDSIAVDAGDDASCSAVDQRGAPRPQGAHCDLGAVELDETPPTMLSTFPENNGIWIIDQPVELTVTFTEQMNQYRADGHVADANNYMLVNDNGDGFQTNSCADGVATGDQEYNINAVTYNMSTLTATLMLNYIILPDGSFSGLPEGNYRLFLCGTNPALRDVAGNKLNGGISDAISAFRIIGLDGGSVPENQPLNTEVATFLSPVGSDLSYSLVSGVFKCNSTDNGFFTVENQHLVTNSVFNYEAKNTYVVCLAVNEAGSQIHAQQLTIKVTNLNEAPTNITLSNNTISENLPIGTQVGVLSSSDPDSGSSFIYSLVSGIVGCDGADNSSFTISGSTLKSNVVFDFETKSSYSVCIRSTDNGGLSFQKSFAILILDANDPPSDILLIPSTIAENLPGNSLVGYLIAIDVDGPSTTTFALLPNKAGCSNSGFNWFALTNGNEIRTLAPLDYEAVNSYTLCLRATDSLGNFYEKSITITVLDVDEGIPSSVVISGNAGIAGATLSYADGTVKTTAADGSGNYSFQVPHNWSGTVTPSKPGYVFTPASRTYANIISNQVAQNYWLTFPAEWSGGVSISSDQPVVAVARPHVGAEVMTYNGFGGGSTTMYVPMLFKNAFGGDYKAALYVQNVSDSASANVSISYYDSTGALTCSVTNETLTPLASKGYWLPTIACLPSGWVGGAVVTSDQPVMAVGRPHIGSQVTTYAGFGSGSLSMYAPMLFKNAFATGTYNAALYIQNTDPSLSATAAIDFYDSNGSLTCSLTGEMIAPLATKGYWIPSVPCLPVGWVGGAVVSSDQPIVAVARPHIGSQVTTYNGFSAGSPSLRVPMLFKNAFAGGTYNAALYIQNTDPTLAATVTIDFYDSNGSLTCSLTDETIAPLATKGYWIPSVACLPTGWVGGAVISADREVVAVGRPHVGSEVATYGGFATGSTEMYLPMLFKDAFGGSYDSAVYVQNTSGSNPANVTFKFYDTVGNLSCLKAASIPAGATVGYWLPTLTCTP